MGVRTLGALRALPRDGLRRRFGNELLDHLDRLHGDIDDPLACYAPPDHFDARIELGYEVESHQALLFPLRRLVRSEEHTSELQSLMRISYAVFCLKKQTPTQDHTLTQDQQDN